MQRLIEGTIRGHLNTSLILWSSQYQLSLSQLEAKEAGLYSLPCPGQGRQGVILDKAAHLRREQCLERGSAVSSQGLNRPVAKEHVP